MRMDDKEIQKLIKQLNDPDKRFRYRAVWALEEAARNGQDITPAGPALGNALSDENGDVRRNVAWALTRHYANKGEWDKVEELLKHPDKNVRANATEALEKIAKDCESIEMLDVIQKGVENAFKEWKRKQPQEPSKEKIDRQIKTSKFIMRISKRKAELSKKDGELLLGDTVKKPKNKGKKMYREIRRVSRNG